MRNLLISFHGKLQVIHISPWVGPWISPCTKETWVQATPARTPSIAQATSCSATMGCLTTKIYRLSICSSSMKLFFEASKNKDPTTRLFCKYLHRRFDTCLKYSKISPCGNFVCKFHCEESHLFECSPNVVFLQTLVGASMFFCQKLEGSTHRMLPNHQPRRRYLRLSNEPWCSNPTRRKSWSCVFLQRIWPCTLRSVSWTHEEIPIFKWD